MAARRPGLGSKIVLTPIFRAGVSWVAMIRDNSLMASCFSRVSGAAPLPPYLIHLPGHRKKKVGL